MSQAIATQLPQVAPQPVRIVNSVIDAQPAAAALRMSVSVTPLQTQTYTAGALTMDGPSFRQK